jgi:hypothetical protein
VPFVNRVFAHRNLAVHARVAGPAGVASVWGGFARMNFPLDPSPVKVVESVRVASAQGVFAHRNLPSSVPLDPNPARVMRSAPVTFVLIGEGPIKLVSAHRFPLKASAAWGTRSAPAACVKRMVCAHRLPLKASAAWGTRSAPAAFVKRMVSAHRFPLKASAARGTRSAPAAVVCQRVFVHGFPLD